MRERLRRLLRHGLFHNILFLSGVQFASYLFPLVSVPYLTRVLGPTVWGMVAFTSAFVACIGLLVEYGFGFSATREAATYRDTRDRLADLLAGVLGAKMLLALLGVSLALLVQRWVTIFQEHPALLLAGLVGILAQSLSPMWYYQGLERMRMVATLDISARVLATAGIFLLVRSPEDGWKVLALQGLASLLSTSVALRLAYREVPFRFPTLSLSWKTLQAGWNMFIFNSAVSLYTVGNSFILGLFAPPQFVGYYAGAEKFIIALLRLFEPVSQALYPRLSHLIHHSRADAARLARIGILLMGLSGVLMGLVIFLSAPLLVRILLGEEFAPAVPVLRVLALLLPLVALSTALYSQWILPLRLDRLFITVILGTGLLNLILAVVLAPRYFALGMAWAVVASELFVTLGSIYILWRWRGSTP